MHDRNNSKFLGNIKIGFAHCWHLFNQSCIIKRLLKFLCKRFIPQVKSAYTKIQTLSKILVANSFEFHISFIVCSTYPKPVSLYPQSGEAVK